MGDKYSFPRDFRRFVGIIICGNNFAKVSKRLAFYKAFKI